jgi:hypothetical protein
MAPRTVQSLGDSTAVVTPVPISNTVVKHRRADDTWGQPVPGKVGRRRDLGLLHQNGSHQCAETLWKKLFASGGEFFLYNKQNIIAAEMPVALISRYSPIIFSLLKRFY